MHMHALATGFIYWSTAAFPVKEQVKRMDYEVFMFFGVGPEQGKQYSEGRIGSASRKGHVRPLLVDCHSPRYTGELALSLQGKSPNE